MCWPSRQFLLGQVLKATLKIQCHADPFSVQGPTVPAKLRREHWDRSTQPFFLRTDPLKRSRNREQSMIVVPAAYNLNAKRQASFVESHWKGDHR